MDKTRCLEHHEYFKEEICPGCSQQIDKYGNSEDDFRYCCFPNCGCDGARLCMAPGGASETSLSNNVEGMYRRTDPEARQARLRLVDMVYELEKGNG